MTHITRELFYLLLRKLEMPCKLKAMIFQRNVNIMKSPKIRYAK